MPARRDLLIGHMTHVGMERSNNQDFLGFFEPDDDAEFERLGRLLIVCDGMGGHAGGEVASQLATQTIIERYQGYDGDDPGEALRGAIEAANRAVWDRAQEVPELHGMGTTVVAAAMRAGTIYVGHVGDSRCYRVRDHHLHPMTLDHSLVQQLVNDGVIAEDEMESHEEKNVILRSLGVRPDVEVELSVHPYEVDDIYLLASDGLTGLVSKQECAQAVVYYRDDPAYAAAFLVDLANRYGGYDNVTVVVARVRALSAAEAEALPHPEPRAPVVGADSASSGAFAAIGDVAGAATHAAQAAAAAAHAAQTAAQAAHGAAQAAQGAAQAAAAAVQAAAAAAQQAAIAASAAAEAARSAAAIAAMSGAGAAPAEAGSVAPPDAGARTGEAPESAGDEAQTGEPSSATSEGEAAGAGAAHAEEPAGERAPRDREGAAKPAEHARADPGAKDTAEA